MDIFRANITNLIQRTILVKYTFGTIKLNNEVISSFDKVLRKLNHETGKAVDITPLPVKFDGLKSFYSLAGLIA